MTNRTNLEELPGLVELLRTPITVPYVLPKEAIADLRHIEVERTKAADTLEHLAAEVGRYQWQPIETAPRDEWILVFMPAEDGAMGATHAARHQAISNGHMWIIGHHFGSDLAGPPTHWMPLPEPPIARKALGGSEG